MNDEPDYEAARVYTRKWLKDTIGWFSAGAGFLLRASELCSHAAALDFDGKKILSYWDEGKVQSLIADADAGSAEAHQAVCNIIADHIKEETPLPPFLRDFLLELLAGNRDKPAKRRGWDTSARYGRDECIRLIVAELTSSEFGYGLNRTRDPKRTNNPSACSIVAEALAELGVQRVSERAIEEITRGKPPGVGIFQF